MVTISCHQLLLPSVIINLMMKTLPIKLLLCLCILMSMSNGDRIKQKIYKSIESDFFCFRRLSASHQIGCNSKEGGNVGTVHIVDDDKDIDHVVTSGSLDPYIAAIYPRHLNLKTLLRFKESADRVSGVVVLDVRSPNRSLLTGLTDDQSCPNDGFDLYVNDTKFRHCQQQEWNLIDGPHSTGLMYQDWPFPIFAIKNTTDITNIQKCFKEFGGPSYPICGLHLDSAMNAAKDSKTCIRRSDLSTQSYSLSPLLYCDPLGGRNIFSTLLWTSKNDTIEKDSLIVLATRLDSYSMFDNISPGADSVITGVVTLLAVAKTLNDVREEFQKERTNGKNILFAFFDGEAFDYIGSSRVLFDMNSGKFPVKNDSETDLAQIRGNQFSHFIELNQLAPHPSNTETVWIHKNVNSSDGFKTLRQLLVDSGKSADLTVDAVEDGRPLPPASLQTFHKQYKDLTGVVLSNHQKEYTNKFYNSMHDDNDWANVNITDPNLAKRLANIATTVARVVYRLATQKDRPDLVANQTLVKEMLDCYLNNSYCDLFKRVSSPDQKFPDQIGRPYQTYVGVSAATNLYRIYTHSLLTYFVSDTNKTDTKSTCEQNNKESKKFNYYWISGPTGTGVCIRSQAFQTEAVSPAFLSQGVVTDPELYSTWTESRWTSSSVRLFIIPSPLQQWLTLIIGLFFTFASFILLYFLDKKSPILFETSIDSIVTQQSLPVGC